MLHKRGFTIVELLIVIVVVPFLAAITIVLRITVYRQRARDTQRISDITSIHKVTRSVQSNKWRLPNGHINIRKRQLWIEHRINPVHLWSILYQCILARRPSIQQTTELDSIVTIAILQILWQPYGCPGKGGLMVLYAIGFWEHCLPFQRATHSHFVVVRAGVVVAVTFRAKGLKMARRSGFTIVELLIVIVVIAILAAITIVTYNGIQQRARDAQRKSDVANIAKLLSLWAADKGPMSTGSGCGGSGNGGGWFNYESTSSKPTVSNLYNELFKLCWLYISHY